MKPNLSFVKPISKAASSFFKAHYGFVLFLVFLSALALWGYVFFQYGYQVVTAEPHASVKPLVVKKSDLEKIVADMDARAAFGGTIMQKTFPDPFVQIPEETRQ